MQMTSYNTHEIFPNSVGIYIKDKIYFAMRYGEF